jgi:DnaK suppressor protein
MAKSAKSAKKKAPVKAAKKPASKTSAKKKVAPAKKPAEKSTTKKTAKKVATPAPKAAAKPAPKSIPPKAKSIPPKAKSIPPKAKSIPPKAKSIPPAAEAKRPSITPEPKKAPVERDEDDREEESEERETSRETPRTSPRPTPRGDGPREAVSAHPDAHLTQEEVETLYEKLVAERERVVVGFDRHLQEALGETTVMPDETDMAQRSTEQAYLIRFADKERKLLSEIEHALEKLRTGEYGVCEGTEEAIGYKRLELRPWTRYSVAFKEQMERERSQHRR